MFILKIFKIFKIKFLIILSIFNIFYLNLILLNFIKRLILIGFKKNYILIIYILGCLEISFYINKYIKLNIFHFIYLLGLIFKNQSFHFELISLNIIFFTSFLSLKFQKLIINNLIFIKIKKNYLNKIYFINNNIFKVFLKYLNFFINF